MSTPTFTASLTIGELESSYPIYCKAMRILIRDGVSEAKARRTVCWHRLNALHTYAPRRYQHPEQLYFVLRLQLTTEGHQKTAAAARLK